MPNHILQILRLLRFAMLISFLWPLTLSPLHWLNFRMLRWKKWGYAGLLLLGNLLITALVLMVREGS